MNLSDFPQEELEWTQEPVIGIVLMGAERDSNGDAINSMLYYKVAKHTKTGMLVILPTQRNMKHEFVNEALHKQGKFN